MKQTKLRKRSKSPIPKAKQRIQALIRQNVIARDGGCVLRNYPTGWKCGGPLQADHINSRRFPNTYGLLENSICLCYGHHIGWKQTFPALWAQYIKDYIGTRKWNKLVKLAQEKTAPKSLNEWLAIEENLKKELRKYETK